MARIPSLHSIRLWLRALLLSNKADAELDREISSHLAMETDHQQTRGIDAAEAERRARVAFGGVERFKEAVRDERGVRPLEELAGDIRYALRGLRRAPAFAAAAIFALATGIGAATAATAIVANVLARPLPYPESARLAFITEATDRGDPMLTSFPNFDDWRTRAKSFSGIGAFSSADNTPVVAGSDAARARVQQVSRELFAVLGTQPILGRTFLPDENRRGALPLAVVSEPFWREHFGSGATPGTATLQLYGATFTIIGVMPAGFRVDDDVDIWTALERSPVMVRGAGNYWVVGRLANGKTLADARREMNVIAAGLKHEYGDASVSSRVQLTSLLDRIVGDSRIPLLMLFGAAALVLIATCASTAMMQLARGASRESEMGVRTALGAGRMRLVRQLITEQLTLAALGCAAGIAVAYGAIGLARVYAAGTLPRLDEVRLDGGVIALSIAVGTLTVVLFGLGPVLRLLRRPTAGVTMSLRGANAGNRRRFSVLVGAESAMTVALLVGSALLLRTVYKVVSADVGYDRRGLVSANLPFVGAQYRDLAERISTADRIGTSLRAVPGVQAVAFTSALPTDRGGNRGPILVPPFGDPLAQKSWASIAALRVVSPNYFQTLGIPLAEGRLLDETDRAQSKVVVINRALAAKLWPHADPIGKTLRALVDQHNDTLTVVGVVGDARSWRSGPGTQQELYVTLWQRPENAWQLNAVLKVAGAPEQVVGATRERIRAIDPTIAPVIRTFDETVANSIRDKRFVAGVLVAFAAVVLLLTITGIFGSVSYSVAQRRREIGIRMAIGASRSEVWLLVQRGIVLSALVGCAVGIVLAFTMGSVTSSLLYDMTARDPAAFIAAAAVAIVATIIAAGIPAYRATRMDPAVSIRTD